MKEFQISEFYVLNVQISKGRNITLKAVIARYYEKRGKLKNKNRNCKQDLLRKEIHCSVNRKHQFEDTARDTIHKADKIENMGVDIQNT